MSLKGFHVLFITLSCMISVGFGLWCFLHENARSVPYATTLGTISLAAGVGLVIYGVLFLQKIRKLP